MLIYKYGFSLKDALNLTIPQIEILNNQLMRICKAEAGEKVIEDEVPMDVRDKNTRVYGDMVNLLKEKTGRQSFTFKELLDPAGTIAKYKKA